MFVPNVFSFATEGKCYRYGSVRMPVGMWGPWHEGDDRSEGSLAMCNALCAPCFARG